MKDGQMMKDEDDGGEERRGNPIITVVIMMVIWKREGEMEKERTEVHDVGLKKRNEDHEIPLI